MNGWIKLHRKLLDNELWTHEPFTKGQAWVDLLMLANHKDREIIIGNRVLVCKRGQIIRSYGTLAKRWKWGIKKVRMFLELLKNMQNLDTETAVIATRITICNYNSYQDLGQAEGTEEGQQGARRGHGEGTERATNKNVKNEKKEKNDKKIRIRAFAPPTVEDVKSYCLERANLVDAERFIDFYSSKGWMVGKTKMRDWQAAVRTWEKTTNKPTRQYGRQELTDEDTMRTLTMELD